MNIKQIFNKVSLLLAVAFVLSALQCNGISMPTDKMCGVSQTDCCCQIAANDCSCNLRSSSPAATDPPVLNMLPLEISTAIIKTKDSTNHLFINKKNETRFPALSAKLNTIKFSRTIVSKKDFT